jgi:hypothetical protein
MPAWIRSFGKNRSTTDAVRTALSSHGWIRISFSVARTNPYGTTAHGVRRAKAALSSGCKPHPAIAPAGSNRSSHGGNEVAEAFD